MDSGWKIIRGAGGFVAVHDANKWSTSVYKEREQAAAAAEKLEADAVATLERNERVRMVLHELYGRRERAKAREERA